MMRTIRRLAVCLFTAILAVASMNSMAQNSHTLPLVLPASNAALAGFVRIINNTSGSGNVSITAIDDAGSRFGPITLNLESEQTVNFNSRDLENGNARKGLSGGVGNGEGNWRLILDSDLGITPLAYIRTTDGFVTTMHNVAPETEPGSRQYQIVFFNPGANNRQVSRLRLINPGTSPAEIEITGRDDAGDTAPGGTVRLTVPAGGARTLTAQTLESGGEGITGNLGQGTGKWQLTVSSNVSIDAVSLLQSPTGHLANLSTTPESNDRLTLPLVLPASESALTGFVRIINRSGESGSVRVTAIDDTGRRFGPVTLNLESNETVNFNSRDLEQGNASKGLSGGVGNGQGNWRLEFNTTLDVATLAYIRTSDGFVTSMHNVAPSTDRNHRVRFFNPGANTRQVSQLRLTNPGTAAARVEITGRDDAGDTAPGGTVGLSLAAGESRTLTAQALESGGTGLTGSLGDGAGKWSLNVSANRDIDVMSLLQSPTGHLANLSTSPSEDAPASFAGAVPLNLENETISGQFDSADDVDYYSVTVDEPTIIMLDGDDNIIITVFDEQGNVIAQSSATSAAVEGKGDIQYNLIVRGVTWVATNVGKYIIKVAKNPQSLRRDYRIVRFLGQLALQKLTGSVTPSIKYGQQSASIDLSDFIKGDADAIRGDISFTPFTLNIPHWGTTVTLLDYVGTHNLRVGLQTTRQCGYGVDYWFEGNIRLILKWEQRIRAETFYPIELDFGSIPVAIDRTDAPRRIDETRNNIQVNVEAGGRKQIRLTDYIMNPVDRNGDSMTFTVDNDSVPAGWHVEVNGSLLTVRADIDAPNGTMTVTAHNGIPDCWNFQVDLRVAGDYSCCDFRVRDTDYGDTWSECVCHDVTNTCQLYANHNAVSRLKTVERCPSSYNSKCCIWTSETGGHRSCACSSLGLSSRDCEQLYGGSAVENCSVDRISRGQAGFPDFADILQSPSRHVPRPDFLRTIE